MIRSQDMSKGFQIQKKVRAVLWGVIDHHSKSQLRKKFLNFSYENNPNQIPFRLPKDVFCNFHHFSLIIILVQVTVFYRPPSKKKNKKDTQPITHNRILGHN